MSPVTYHRVKYSTDEAQQIIVIITVLTINFVLVLFSLQHINFFLLYSIHVYSTLFFSTEGHIKVFFHVFYGNKAIVFLALLFGR